MSNRGFSVKPVVRSYRLDTALYQNLPLPLHFTRRQLKAVERVQNALNENDLMNKILPHLSRNSDRMVREILAFLSVMLFAANVNVQVKQEFHILNYLHYATACIKIQFLTIP